MFVFYFNILFILKICQHPNEIVQDLFMNRVVIHCPTTPTLICYVSYRQHAIILMSLSWLHLCNRICKWSTCIHSPRHPPLWLSWTLYCPISQGNSKHFLILLHGGKKLNLELSFKTKSKSRMWYFFSANFYLMSFLTELSLEIYSRPVDLSQFETSLKLSI